MNRIRILPESLANQIAAGEVIERPASVVKELLENSIDAGATDIHIEISKGGTGLIRIRDNGHGIHNEDMKLALQSHATSKIRDMSDLEKIATLGFRGEALPSIASVSQFQLTSRARDSEQAWQFGKEADSGLSALVPASHPTGTTVEVKNLFHTTPARRKFLKSVKTEYLHILEMLRRIALSRPGMTIRMVHNGKQVFFCKSDAGNRRPLIESIMGRSFLLNARAFEFNADGMHLMGWAGPAGVSRSQSDRQYFYLNGRMIRDRQINHAIRLAYEDALPTGRYPVYVIYLDMDPGATDINVHPTKHEVRFKNARDVHDFLLASMKQIVIEDRRFTDGNDFVAPSYANRVSPDIKYHNGAAEPVSWYGRLSGAGKAVDIQDITDLGQPVVNIYGRFIITKRQDSYLLVDIYRARRHIIRTGMQAVRGGRTQRNRPLLVPVSINVTRREADLIETYSDTIGQYGLKLDRNTPESVVIRNIPGILPEVELDKLVQEISRVIVKVSDPETIHNNLVSIFENHAGDGMTEDLKMDEIVRLLRSLEDTGIDTHAAEYPGIWKTLDIDMLADII